MGVRRESIVAGIVLALVSVVQAQDAASKTFSNPVIRSCDAPDPWVVFKDGWYYFSGDV